MTKTFCPVFLTIQVEDNSMTMMKAPRTIASSCVCLQIGLATLLGRYGGNETYKTVYPKLLMMILAKPPSPEVGNVVSIATPQ